VENQLIPTRREIVATMPDHCLWLARQVDRVRHSWPAEDLTLEPASAETRRLWLAAIAPLLSAEAALERDVCDCPRCRQSRRRLVELRSRVAKLAETTGLPLPLAGEEMRLPVHTARLEARAERLVASRSVVPLGKQQYLVHTPGGTHLVHAGRPEHWETDWTCSCAWSQPYPPDQRPGRGCTHVRAVRAYREGHRYLGPVAQRSTEPRLTGRPQKRLTSSLNADGALN
jgi:hypothetical protein